MNILVIGSAPDAVQVKNWELSVFDQVIAINNAWQITDKWNQLIFPYDFPNENKPATVLAHQTIVTEEQFVLAQNFFGGFVYAGATMAFTAGYWSLATYKPSKICFLGCNMHYSQSGATHFYGTGKPDPLRKDISLTSLKACSYRMLILSKIHGCDVVSLSAGETNLHIPQTSFHALADYQAKIVISERKLDEALNREKQLDYYVEDGRYWEKEKLFCRNELEKLDQIWIDALSSGLDNSDRAK